MLELSYTGLPGAAVGSKTCGTFRAHPCVLSRGSVRSGPTGVLLSRDVSIGNQQGFNILGSATLTKVTAVGNLGGGIVLRAAANVTVANSNIFGNATTAGNCGVINQSDTNTVAVSNSFWGAPTGPGPAPANAVCDDEGSTTLVPSAAPEAFRISSDPWPVGSALYRHATRHPGGARRRSSQSKAPFVATAAAAFGPWSTALCVIADIDYPRYCSAAH
jgi:hypothetical protein